MISVLTFNTATQDVRLFGKSVYRPIDFTQERLTELTKQLKESKVDIICLQEFFHADLQKHLFTSLKSEYPYAAGFARTGFKLRLGNELLILSRFPLENGKLARFNHATFGERVFTSKGMYKINIEIPGIEKLQLITFHMTAGGLLNHPESKKMEAIRSAQIRQLLEFTSENIPTILAGDLNAGPESSKDNYYQLLQKGLIDAFTHGNGDGITWDPVNPLVVSGDENHLPPQRIDHIFLNRKAANKLEPKNSRIVLNEISVNLSDGRKITVSDHYGVQVDFNLA
ncbi:MAG: endonuclease/exonuclease/phosphatase family protein [Gammaproteobacteria bacterium]|nr:endonuclease/exonuclease/phosphatase family protein [Gammaproteobacteria bacterium]